MHVARLLVFLSLSSTLLCCGEEDSPKMLTFAEFFPADNEVGDWAAEDGAALDIAADETALFALINGSATAVLDYTQTFVKYGSKRYTDGTYNLELCIWQFAEAATASKGYNGFKEHSENSGHDWADVTHLGGDKQRVGDTGLYWIYNILSGVYFVDVDSIGRTDSQQTESEAALAADPFVQAVVARLP